MAKLKDKLPFLFPLQRRSLAKASFELRNNKLKSSVVVQENEYFAFFLCLDKMQVICLNLGERTYEKTNEGRNDLVSE